MATILVIGETTGGALSDASRELVNAAISLGGPITLGLISAGDGVAPAPLVGVETVATTVVPFLDSESRRQAVDALIAHTSPGVVLLPFTITSAAFAAGIAETLNLGFASDIVALSRDAAGNLIAQKSVYGGQVVAELEFPTDSPTLILVRQGVFAPAADGGSPAVVEVPIDNYVAPKAQHVELIVPESEVDLKNADVIFSVGRAVGGKENIKQFASLAENAGAVLGASRPVIDAGWLPPGHQVGQTGVSVKPRVYVAFGISGAQQHLAGIGGAKTVIAINSDANAPIFGVANYGAVADIFEVAAALKSLLATQGNLK